MPIHHLRKVLSIIPTGIVRTEQHSAVVSQLAECWDHLTGSAEGGMTAAKVWRCEDLSWTPPILSFQIERHGGVVLGSKRAEMQTWTIDVTQATATLAYTGRR